MKRLPFFQFSLLLLTALFSVLGCNKNNQTHTDQKTKISKAIVALAIVPEKTFVEKIAGDDFEIVLMIPPGYSPTNYEPTPAQMQLFSKAHYYFTMCMPTEKNTILPHLNPKTELIDLAEVVASRYPDLTLTEHHHHDDEEGQLHEEEELHASEAIAEHSHDEEEEHTDRERDPHIWLSPKRSILMVEKMAEALIKIAPSPERANAYQANAKKYIEEIQKADNQIRQELAKGKCRDFFVFHPSFGYFAEEYELTQHSLEKAGKEATAKHLVEMIKLAKEKGIKAIFCQAEIDSRQTKAFAEEIKGKTYQLDPLAADYPQNLVRMAKQIASTLVE